jgi:hypothetical protein
MTPKINLIKTLDDSSRWAKLRLFGNSHVVQSTVIVPLLGYFLLFNTHVFEYLRLHTDFCSSYRCDISWRLHLIYFGFFFIAVGASIYAIRCPSVIKAHGAGADFFESEKTYFSAPRNLSHLFELIETTTGIKSFDPGNLKDVALNNRAVQPDEMYALADLMADYYVLQNLSRRGSRIATIVTYGLGLLFLMVPTIITFIQIALQSTLGVTL